MSQTVLVADDSQTIRKVVQMALKASKFEVVGVGSAREAVEAAQQRPSVILLDYYMPDGSGYDVCRALKNNNATSQIPIIMLGGTYKNFDANLARDSGASLVVMKPFHTDELVEAIETAVAGGGAVAQPAAVQAAAQPPAAQPPVAQQGSRPRSQPQHPTGQQGSRPRSQPQPTHPGGSGPQPMTQTPVPESQPRIPVQSGSQSRVPPSSGPQGSQPRIPSGGSQPRIASGEAKSAPRQRQPTPSPGASASSAAPAMSQSEIQEFIREEVKSAVRAELPGLLRNVMGEVFQQKVLPKLLKHSDDKIQKTLDDQLARRISQQVRLELERLLNEE